MCSNKPGLPLYFQDHYIYKQLSSMLMFALDENFKIKFEFDIFRLYLVFRPLTFRSNIFELIQTSQTSCNECYDILHSYIKLKMLRSFIVRLVRLYCVRFDLLHSILFLIRSFNLNL